MKDELLNLLNNAYAPYSNFPVSACLITNDGRKFYGVNVEDASTRAGVCAERNAIFSAITAGCKKGDFKEINIMTSSNNTIGMPCFVCRQMFSELFDPNMIVRCFNKNGEYVEHTVKELCPYPFGEDDLK